jgi:hypothetical protein
MGTCMQTTRVAQAINSVQLFTQRCLLNLETEGSADVAVSPGQIDAPTWTTWMGSYSLWAANREVFFYPENWLLPPLRDDQTPLYQTFASSLQQGTITNDAVSALFLTYLQGLDQVDRLDIRTVVWQPPDPSEPNSAGILHVFGRTFHTPRQYFYRQLISGQGWTPWQLVQADTDDDHLVAAIWAGKLRLIWPVFTRQAFAPPPGSLQLTTAAGSQQTPVPGQAADNYWQVTLAWSEYYQGAWQPKSVTDAFLNSYFSPSILGPLTNPFYPNPQAPAQSAHVFKARLDGADLVVDMYVELTTFDGLDQPGILLDQPQLLGEFRFSACGDSVSVAYSSLQTGDPVTLGVPDSPGLSREVIESSALVMPPSTDVYYNGFRQNSGAPAGLTLPTANIGDNPIPGFIPPTDPVKFLNASPSQFELRISQQDWQFALQDPFFYQDNDRTFFVQPSQGWPIICQIRDRVEVDLPGLLVSALAAGPVAVNPREPVKAGQAAPPMLRRPPGWRRHRSPGRTRRRRPATTGLPRPSISAASTCRRR